MNKEDLFKKLRDNTPRQYDMPLVNVKGIQYKDTYAQFKAMCQQMGANVAEASKTDDLDQLVHNLYPKATTFASNLPFIHIATKNPDTVEAAELNGTDVGIVMGQTGVAENGCIWIPQTMKEKAVLFISEYLVIFIDRQDIVDNMHQAYARIKMDSRYNFGTFISGPSKTADIEQALVMGAQAARGVTVVILQ
ncbi:MAG: LutC/YkgG family protein [Prevotella sp.]|jgi:L-lactate dehydrogenase complex protein LldG